MVGHKNKEMSESLLKKLKLYVFPFPAVNLIALQFSFFYVFNLDRYNKSQKIEPMLSQI